MDLYQQLIALAQIVMIDLVLAGDNAIVVGMAASRVAPEMRTRVIFWGVAGAVALRVVFAAMAMQLLAIVGLMLAGGILLLWVCWKMYRELSVSHEDEHEATEALADADLNADGTVAGKSKKKTLKAAVWQIVIADVSMSLDNVLAVAGAAQHHEVALIFGLGLSVLLMGVAATLVAGLLHRYRWIAWVGLVIILYVAVKMLYEGADQLLGHTLPMIPLIKGAPAVPAVH
jgi:YjbE family integral membrane protein